MSSLYEQLMAAKGAPQAAPPLNSSQMIMPPMSLQSAMRKYAEAEGAQFLPQPNTPTPSTPPTNTYKQNKFGIPPEIYSLMPPQMPMLTQRPEKPRGPVAEPQIYDYTMPSAPMPPQMPVTEQRPEKPSGPVVEPEYYDYTMPVFPEKNQQNSGFNGVSPDSMPGTPDTDFNSRFGKPDPNFYGSLYEPLMPKPSFDENVIEQKKNAFLNVLRELGISPAELQEMIFEDKMSGNQRSLMSLIQEIRGK